MFRQTSSCAFKLFEEPKITPCSETLSCGSDYGGISKFWSSAYQCGAAFAVIAILPSVGRAAATGSCKTTRSRSPASICKSSSCCLSTFWLSQIR